MILPAPMKRAKVIKPKATISLVRRFVIKIRKGESIEGRNFSAIEPDFGVYLEVLFIFFIIFMLNISFSKF